MALDGRVVVVTGASGGIGAEIVRVLVDHGAKVVAVDLNQDAVDAVAAQYDGTVAACAADVSKYDDVAAMINAAVDSFGTFDCVVNNAGINILGAMVLGDDFLDQWNAVTAVNQTGVVNGIRAAALKLVELGKPGVIINTSSVYGSLAANMTWPYNVSKAAVDMMTKSSALELGPHGIRVVAVAPGRVDTPMLREGKKIGLWEHMRTEQVRDQFTQPSEIAEVIAFLASDAANAINGSTVAAEDGYLSFKFPLVPSEEQAAIEVEKYPDA